MANDYSHKSDRSAVDIFHFAVGCAGLFIGIAGVAISVIPVCLLGAALALWGLAYFGLAD